MFCIDGLSVATAIHLIIAVPLCGHVLLRKDQEPVAVGWIALILLSPFVGSALYGIFGISRLERTARALRGQADIATGKIVTLSASVDRTKADPRILQLAVPVTDFPFVPGNSVEPLLNGDQAYPAMLGAIGKAQKSIALSTYIFDSDATGQQFVTALSQAVRRGVVVYVLVDGVGVYYSPRAIDRDLVAGGVKVARFIPPTLRFLRFFNLRNHRKILVADGMVGFIGGMNIRHGNVIAAATQHAVQDIHFRVRGAVLDQLSALFAEDWHFATGTEIELPQWKEDTPAPAASAARLVPDGPDHRSETLQWLILGALAFSQRRIRIMTPYFIPNGQLVSALAIAAMRGIDVEILIPEKTNIQFVGWAMAANFERLMTHGVKIYLNPPPFDHSKVMVVDGNWVLVGSTNWDQRSLRLNFEANLECFDASLAEALEKYFDTKKACSKAVSLAAVQAAPLWIRLRNNFVRLFGPYL